MCGSVLQPKFYENTTKVFYKMEDYNGTVPEIEINTLINENVDEIELIAQLVQSEAGNQDLMGKRYVVDVILNRVDSEKFPDTVEDVIFQDNQFTVIKDGAFDKAESNISDESFEAAKIEYYDRSNYDILYFSRGKSKYATEFFKHQDHWFGW